MLRTFSIEDQLKFAELSGDWNPLHCDPVAARRVLVGSPIVHGVHLVIWILDQLSEGLPGDAAIDHLEADFRNPLPVGQTVELIRGEHSGGRSFSFQVRPHNAEHRAPYEQQQPIYAGVRLTLADKNGGTPPKVEFANPADLDRTLRSPDIQTLGEYSTELPLAFDLGKTEQLFPKAAKQLPIAHLAVLLSCTRLIGMHCPGEHSLFSSLTLQFKLPAEGTPSTRFSTTEWHTRFSRLIIGVESDFVTGTLIAFRRAAPPAQPSFAQIKNAVTAGEFQGQSALVIGGSRGVGEVITKLLAAGGAEVTSTYHRGKVDADSLATELSAQGAKLTVQQLDVLDKAQVWKVIDSLPSLTHLYFLATPPLAHLRDDLFSNEQFRRFSSYYVEGFAAIASAASRRKGGCSLFYPSSIAIEELPPLMLEYSVAKAAGEQLCAFVQRYLPGLSIYAPRLPRLETDLTSSLIRSAAASPVETLLPHLRWFHSHRTSSTHPPG